MDTGDWGLILGGGSLLIHIWRFLWERGRATKIERRQHLSELALSLIELREAAQAHFDSAPDAATERALTSRLDTARHLAGRVPWDDVRRDALAVVAAAERVLDRNERVKPDADVELPRAIARALTKANATIDARMNELRGKGRPKTRG